ncbi:MAG: 3-hydroxyacyl-CoA dehydrogenase family protein [Candidatus Bathyarchaeota archaeon]|nr:3-hydroxyacyl-CoA dehydrogenase family protein [Candidatus Bathyarchaeota archaeon]
MEVRKIAVLGAGLMGHGIAQVAAQVGKYEVSVRDVEQRFLDGGMGMIRESLQRFLRKGKITEAEMNETLARIHPTLDLKEAVSNADLIIEAVPENVDLKKAIYREVDGLAPAHAIIASNTSSISITELASATNRPEKVCGMHFFNPPQLMKLVEVIKGAKTSDETIQTVLDVSHKMGKETVLVKKDCPGFIVNRILIPALNEAAALYWEGIADRDDIDNAIKLGLNWPMGPLMLIDYIGADTTLAIAEVLMREVDPKFHPSPGLKQMVKARLLGRKTGKGFYDWTQK